MADPTPTDPAASRADTDDFHLRITWTKDPEGGLKATLESGVDLADMPPGLIRQIAGRAALVIGEQLLTSRVEGYEDADDDL